MSDQKQKLPELLCPAGSPEALDAAIEGGADAVYLGSSSFNARMHAKNFGGDDLRSAVLRAHRYGVKIYLTLNTLATEREMTAYLDAAGEALDAGVDALIVADLGGAAALRRVFPSAELHASTQLSGHNSQMGHELAALGFSRMVLAREVSCEDLRTVIRNNPLEIEYFIHGALCVSHSGQCLFSSAVGGRSGNRGACAQPCRLPYSCGKCASERAKEGYPLSLKDLSLAAHVPTLIDAGVSSLKIEGRMKSPEYVRDTARIWRRLLDERRGATSEEMKALSEVFSRGGFTDAYFTKTIGHGMLGIRSDADKSRTRTVEPFAGLTRKCPISMTAVIQKERPITLTVTDGTRAVTAEGDIPMQAENAPLTHETVTRNLSKLGGTPYSLTSLDLSLDEGLMLPISRLNELRRRALAAWESNSLPAQAERREYLPIRSESRRTPRRTARFLTKEQITPHARAFFERIYLPLTHYAPIADGVILPPVIFDSEAERVRGMLRHARKNGARYALVGNLGHLSLVCEEGLIPIGDYRLNLTNPEGVAQAERLGLDEAILSPELTLPQIRDIGGNTEAIVYGRLPLMTLEKCVIREIADCKACAECSVTLRDRRGIEFPVLREWEHRNIIYNSLPTSMSDREDELRRAGITARHFLFSVESAEEVDRVIEAYQAHRPLTGAVRRM